MTLYTINMNKTLLTFAMLPGLQMYANAHISRQLNIKRICDGRSDQKSEIRRRHLKS